jgi:hypothetical protein
MRKSSKDEEFHITSRRSDATRQLAYFAGDTSERREFKLAPQVGFEPTTLRLTAEQLVAASRCKHEAYTQKVPISREIGGTLGGPWNGETSGPT